MAPVQLHDLRKVRSTTQTSKGSLAGIKRKAVEDPATNFPAHKGIKSTRSVLLDLTNNAKSVVNSKQYGETSSKSSSTLKTHVKKNFSNIVNRSSRSSASNFTAIVSKNVAKNDEKQTVDKLKHDTFSQSHILLPPVAKYSSIPDRSSPILDDGDCSVISEESYRLVPPPGVIDFDLETWRDPFLYSEYAMGTFMYYKSREKKFVCPDYMGRQPDISPMMRSILVDWMVEIQESFELNHETLYTAVKIMDLYLSRSVSIKKEDLQLIGATAYLIACKVDERIPPLLDDFVYVCDDAYNRNQLIETEKKIIQKIDYDVGYPLSYRFLRRYARVCKVTLSDLTFARYILEMSLLEYDLCIKTYESKLAAAVLVLMLKIKVITGWVDTLRFYSGYSPMDLNDLVQKVFEMIRRPSRDNVTSIRQKYSHEVFHRVALIALPDAIVLTESG